MLEGGTPMLKQKKQKEEKKKGKEERKEGASHRRSIFSNPQDHRHEVSSALDITQLRATARKAHRRQKKLQEVASWSCEALLSSVIFPPTAITNHTTAFNIFHSCQLQTQAKNRY